MNRAAGRVGDTVRDRPIASGRNVWSSNGRIMRVREGESEVREPVWIRVRIVIDVGDNLAGSRFQTSISGVAQPAIRRADHPEPIFTRYLSGVICRPIVDHNHFDVLIIKLAETFTALTDRAGPVAGADHHRYRRPADFSRKWRITERITDGCERRLR